MWDHVGFEGMPGKASRLPRVKVVEIWVGGKGIHVSLNLPNTGWHTLKSLSAMSRLW